MTTIQGFRFYSTPLATALEDVCQALKQRDMPQHMRSTCDRGGRKSHVLSQRLCVVYLCVFLCVGPHVVSDLLLSSLFICQNSGGVTLAA